MYISNHVITSKHYLVLFVSAFAIGIYLATMLGIIFSLSLLALAAVIIGLVYTFLKIKGISKSKYIILSSALIIASFLGIFRIYTAEYLYKNSIREYEGKEAWVCGTITSNPQLSSNSYYYTFELDAFGINNKTDYFGTIMMYVPQNSGFNFETGDNVYAWTKIESPKDAEGTSAFDYYTHLRGKNIFLIGTSENINPLSTFPTTHPLITLKEAGGFIRSKIVNSIDSLFPNDKISAAVLKGILIGDKSGFDDNLYKKFSYAGISHIIAVSGLHISILFSFLMIFSSMFFSKRRLSFLATIPVIILFMSASSFTPSVCRASIMILIMILSTLTREEHNPVTALFIALGSIIAVAPYALFSKSLILSFTATLGIFVYYPYINGLFISLINLPKLKIHKHKIIKKPLIYLSSSFSLSFSSCIGTVYFLILFFGNISKVQFFTNLWIIPIVSVIFCLGYINCIIFYISPWLALNILKYPLQWCLDVIEFTINVFGRKDFTCIFPSELLSGNHAIVYFGIAFMIYMFLKTFNDIQTEKKIAAEEFDRLKY